MRFDSPSKLKEISEEEDFQASQRSLSPVLSSPSKDVLSRRRHRRYSSMNEKEIKTVGTLQNTSISPQQCSNFKSQSFRANVLLRLAEERMLFETENEFAGIPLSSKEEFDEKYEMSELLGDGATCSVRLGTQKSTQIRVAIKILEIEKLKLNRSIRREVAILRRLEHSQIPKLLDVIATTENLFIVMQLCNGPPLFDAIIENKHNSNYNEEKAAEIVKKILKAISYLHSRGFAHRDIKPENLIYTTDSQDAEIMLVDFGLARIVSDKGKMTPQGIGTFGYMAPELLKHQQYDESVDMWAFGVICYILLVGFPPFFSHEEDKENEELLSSAPFWLFFNKVTPELREEITEGRIHFPQTFWSKISREAKDFVSSLLQVEPEKRLTAKEALQHPWLTKSSLSKLHLPDTVRHLEKFLIVKKLNRRLQNRPSSKELIANNILKSPQTRVSPALHRNQQLLQRAANKDLLRQRLQRRPSMEYLIENRIILNFEE